MATTAIGFPVSAVETGGRAHRQGVDLYRAGDYAAAAEQFRIARAVDAEPLRTLAFLGLCYEQLGEAESARRCWVELAAKAGGTRLGLLAATRLDRVDTPRVSRDAEQPTELSPATVEPERTVVRTEHFVIEANNRRLAGMIADRAEVHLEAIRAQVLGAGLYPHTVHIRIYPRLVDYRSVAGTPHWSGGGFRVEPQPDGSLRRGVDLIQLGPDDRFNDRLLDRELPHELSHVVVSEFFGQRSCPIWLDEALAMMAEIEPDPARAEVARLAVRFGTYAPLASLLDRNDWPDDYPMSLLYAQAESVGRFLWSQLGDEVGRDLLTQLRLGETVSAALQRSLDRSNGSVFDTLEARWRRVVAADIDAP